MTRRCFKNALCLAPIPDAAGYRYPPWELQCHRRAGHDGEHQVKFRDGNYRKWNYGDKESHIVCPKRGKKA